MKKKTFKRFLNDYVKDMSPDNSLSLFKAEKHASNNARFYHLFLFYVFFNPDVQSHLEAKKDVLPQLYKGLVDYRNKYDGATNENVDYYTQKLNEFDPLSQLYKSYENLVLNHDALLRSLYLNKIKAIQEKKRISNYRIYTDLHLNPGNTNDFLKNGNTQKLSTNNIKQIMNYVSTH